MGKHHKTDCRPDPEQLKGQGGYCDPPADKRIQPGECRNPKGRPKKPPRAVDPLFGALQDILASKVPVSGADGPIKVAVSDLMARRVANEAMSNPEFALKVFKLQLEHGRTLTPPEPDEAGLSDDDHLLLQAHEEKIRRQALGSSGRSAVAAAEPDDE